ncbi:hypothetical protein L596_005511 [Steinernema carpocapsae]|uniref:Uncharacterized protein n=1 Tax=Steinernema carpocapsae TaxID=34508 RepID=A0A4U8V0F4_STECR|nr:hypothetical protein L596_005511 [Steinernema carpocapsae]
MSEGVFFNNFLTAFERRSQQVQKMQRASTFINVAPRHVNTQMSFSCQKLREASFLQRSEQEVLCMFTDASRNNKNVTVNN